ncbi:MAG: NADH-quinone oxidoreductase subunit F, partial [Nitrospira sp.]
MAEARLLEKSTGDPWDLEAYACTGGYEAWKQCVKGGNREEIVNVLKNSGLRGRGGAGFPTGIKWDKVLHHRISEHYFVCNAGEH